MWGAFLEGYIMVEELKSMVGMDETILYEGKPDKKCFILESIFNPLLPISIIWAIIDMGFLGFGRGSMPIFMLPFMLFHMMPVWIYLCGVIFSFRKYKNTYYIVTDHAVYISSGIFTMNLESKTFAELSRVNLHRGILDQMFGVGDVQITTNQFTKKNMPAVLQISSISNYTEVFQMVKKLQKDIYSDIMYPNDLRPKENHGYKTKYRG
jgi:membrane protein YdbS with pleckstrin-like domain